MPGDAREAHLTVAGTVFTIAQRARKRGDALDFDGRGADAFLYSRTTGDWTRYQWDGSLVAMQTGVSTPGMTVIPADFNGDERSDLFAYDTRTGIWARSISASDGTVRFTEAVGDPGWVPTIVDLNGDGRSDVFLYNPQSGDWGAVDHQCDDLAVRRAHWTLQSRMDGVPGASGQQHPRRPVPL